MRYRFENEGELAAGIALLAPDLDIEPVQDAPDLTVCVRVVEETIVEVQLEGKRATVTYGGGSVRFFRGLAMLASWVRDGVCQKRVCERPLFSANGAMVDMSRNAVMNLTTVKAMLRKMALMGLNTFMLYTEDTYELSQHPYFGHMRGRYTKAELKELDAYALALGIELVPCIQMLGHLDTHLQWQAAEAYRDTADALLVGAKETYVLLEDMLRTVSECFTSRRLHVGMDETHDLGTGKYMRRNGYRERQEIYFEHLAKVIELARAYGFEPMMWSDMFFRMAGKGLAGYIDYDPRVVFSQDTVDKVPKGVRQVFWDYYNADESFYAVNLEKHLQVFGENPIFAGGIWTWSGHCPLYSRSLRFTVPALDACRARGVKEIFATIWHNGAECSLIMGLAGLAWYADYDYKGGFDADSVKECLRFSCGASYDDLMRYELPEHPDGGLVSTSRALLHNDPLLGLVDRHLEGMDLQGYYTQVCRQLDEVAAQPALFAPACDTIRALSKLLLHKADFGLRLKAAYDEGDKDALRALASECDLIIERLAALRQSHRKAWMTYSKPFGWEVHDIRYGGLTARFDTVKTLLLAYLSGEVECIPELEEDRLHFVGVKENDPCFPSRFLWMRFGRYATAGVL